MELLSSERLKSLLDLINKVTAIFGREKTDRPRRPSTDDRMRVCLFPSL